MAYSGLGAGTQADPYQITTVSQFKEMDNAAYADVYFLLMNDLDFLAETSVPINSFYCKFDGGGHKMTNYPAASSYLTLQNNSEFYNVDMTCKDESGSIFYGGNVQRSGIKVRNVTIRNTIRADEKAQLVFNGAKYDSTCLIEDFTAEGCFRSSIFGEVDCTLSRVRILNTYTGKCPLFSLGGASLEITDFEYHKPITVTSLSGGGMIGPVSGGCSCKRGIIKVGWVEAPSLTMLANTSYGTGKSYIFEDIAIYAGKITHTQASISYLLYAGYIFPGSVLSINRVVFIGGFETPNQQGRASVFGPSGKVSDSYYSKDRMATIASDKTGEIGLTDAQIPQESSYISWDFINTWDILEGVPTPKSSMTPVIFINPLTCVLLNQIVRDASTQFTVSARSTVNETVHLIIRKNGVVSQTAEMPISSDVAYSTIIVEGESDELFSVDIVSRQGGYTGFILASTTYLHYVNDSAIMVDEYPAIGLASITDGINRAIYIHGSVMVGQNVYGSSRNKTPAPSENGCIVKVPVSDVTAFEITPIVGSAGQKTCGMDFLDYIGGCLYTLASMTNTVSNKRLVKYDVSSDEYQLYNIGLPSSVAVYGAPSCTDGIYLYVYVGNAKVWKIDVSQFNSTEQYNEEIWPLVKTELVYVNHYGECVPHTMCVDDKYLYVGFGTSSITTEHEIQKINKADMTLVAYAAVPKMTDDMCQTDTHLFIGIETYNNAPTTYGVDWGACAIRKSDMRVTAIPKLHKTDTISTKSYASLIFGSYMIDLKTNGYIYAIDISQPDEWQLSENIGQRTLKTYNILQPDGSSDVPGPINEAFLAESGVFIGFVWNIIPSAAVSFDLTGLNYFAAPTIVTDDSTIVDDNDVSLAGFITNTGGKMVTAAGVTLGQSADLSDGVDYPVTPVTTEFEKAFNDLEYGTYYFRAYATNAEGTGYGEIKSFTLEIPYTEPDVATIDAAIVGDNDVSLAGFITNTGGKTVTAVGIILGQAADLSDGVDYPVTPVTTEFEKAFNDLEYGTYYFRTYATNAEGTGYGEIKSFTLEIPYTEPGQPTALDKAIQVEITASWTAPIDDGGTPITGYKIERKASDGDWAVIVANTGDTETSYTETLPQGVYQYRVSAITAYATSQPSATLDVNAVVGGVGKYRIYLGSTEIATIG